MGQFKVDTSEVSKNPRINRETVASQRKSLQDPKIALSGRVNEGERKLGTRRVSWWTRGGVEGRAKKEAGKKDGKRGKKEGEKRLRVRANTRVKPKRGPVPWTLHKPALSTLFSSLPQAGPLYLRPYGPPRSPRLLFSLSSSLIDRKARY